MEQVSGLAADDALSGDTGTISIRPNRALPTKAST